MQLFISCDKPQCLIIAEHFDDAVQKAGGEVTWLCGLDSAAMFTVSARDLVWVEDVGLDEDPAGWAE